MARLDDIRERLGYLKQWREEHKHMWTPEVFAKR
jgi:hypothetical protein